MINYNQCASFHQDIIYYLVIMMIKPRSQPSDHVQPLEKKISDIETKIKEIKKQINL